MTFKDALGFVIDYGKFIVQLWNYYIVLVVGIIGWLVTLRTKDLGLDFRARATVIVCYLLISAIFFFVLEQNHELFTRLMKLVHMHAQIDPIAQKVYGPEVSTDIVWMLNMTTRFALPVIAVLVSLFMWFITAPARKSGPDAAKQAEA